MIYEWIKRSHDALLRSLNILRIIYYTGNKIRYRKRFEKLRVLRFSFEYSYSHFCFWRNESRCTRFRSICWPPDRHIWWHHGWVNIEIANFLQLFRFPERHIWWHGWVNIEIANFLQLFRYKQYAGSIYKQYIASIFQTRRPTIFGMSLKRKSRKSRDPSRVS